MDNYRIQIKTSKMQMKKIEHWNVWRAITFYKKIYVHLYFWVRECFIHFTRESKFLEVENFYSSLYWYVAWLFQTVSAKMYSRVTQYLLLVKLKKWQITMKMPKRFHKSNIILTELQISYVFFFLFTHYFRASTQKTHLKMLFNITNILTQPDVWILYKIIGSQLFDYWPERLFCGIFYSIILKL